MEYLVTGGAGFIGSNLVPKLLELDSKVTIIDNLSTGSLKNLNGNSRMNFINDSVLNLDLMDNEIKKCDSIIHLAAAVGVVNILTNPLESLLTNINGTQNVLALALKYQKPVLIISTSEIYGKNEKVPLNESDDRILGHPLKSRWSYSEAKAIDESLGFFYYKKYGLEVRIVRLFNTVGPRQTGDYGMVLPRFVKSALKGEALKVFGNGNQIRCFCHVSDAIKALLDLIDSDKAIGQVFNVGNNQQISILNLAKKVIEITGSKSQINIIPYSEAYPEGFEDIQKRIPDISKIKNMLGWSPKIGLEEIIKDIASFDLK